MRSGLIGAGIGLPSFSLSIIDQDGAEQGDVSLLDFTTMNISLIID